LVPEKSQFSDRRIIAPHPPAAMRISLLVISALIGLSFAKISKSKMKAKLDEYLESDANPCGKYNNAKECVCKDGTTKYTPSIETVGTCGKEAPDYCLCPDGNKVSPPAELVKATAEYLA